MSPRRTAPARPTSPPAIGKAAIFAAIQPGTRRCRGQREHRRTAYALVDAQPWNAQRKTHYKAVLKRLSAHMDWANRTARPGHEILRGPHRPNCPGPHRPGCARPLAGCKCGERCGCPGRISSDTVRRAIAWFRQAGLLGVVSPGVRADMRSWLHAAEGNLAAIYLCTVPHRRKRQLPCVVAGQGEIAALSVNRREIDIAPRAREAQKAEAARAPRGLTLLPRDRDRPLNSSPKTRAEGLAAAAAVQDRSVWLRELSPEHVRHLARPFFAAGWTGVDVLYALDHEVTGRPHGYATAVRHPAAWARTRLALWTGPDGKPLPSLSQIRAARAAARRADQAARRHQHAAVAAQAVDAAATGIGATARAAIAAASPAFERALAKTRALAARPAPTTQPPTGHPSGPAETPADVGELRRALLARLDTAGLVHAQRHRAQTAARIGGPERAAQARSETAPLIAAAHLAVARREHPSDPHHGEQQTPESVPPESVTPAGRVSGAAPPPSGPTAPESG